MTKHQIIDETVAYYSEDIGRRAVNEVGGCVYFHGKTGNMCAVGRCANEPKYLNPDLFFTSLSDTLSDEEIFKTEYQGHEPEFWAELQKLHDNKRYWNDGGLTEYGQKTVQRLKERFA